MNLNALRIVTLSAVASLVALGVATELWLAPVRPGGSWLVLKVLPLLMCLPGLQQARRYTFQALSLLVWLYFTEGIVRATSSGGPSATLGWLETALALGAFVACVAYARLSAPSRQAAGRD